MNLRFITKWCVESKTCCTMGTGRNWKFSCCPRTSAKLLSAVKTAVACRSIVVLLQSKNYLPLCKLAIDSTSCSSKGIWWLVCKHFKQMFWEFHTLVPKFLSQQLKMIYIQCVLVFLYAAATNLDYITLHGKQMKVSASKHSVVQLPKEGTVVCILSVLSS